MSPTHRSGPGTDPAGLAASGRLVDVALDAVGRGWRVFPLAPGSKRPRVRQWEERATSDRERIARWWRAHAVDNVAVACGPSGLVVVDLDRAKPGDTPPPDAPPGATGGVEVFDQLARRHAPVGCTWTVATPSGGRHLYYRAPVGVELRNTSGRLGWRIDTRAQGGYVVAAGSIVDGRRYELVDPAPPVELPDWLARLLAPPSPPAVEFPAPASVRRSRYVEEAVGAEVARVLDAGEGARNWALNKAAWNLGRLVAAGLLERADVEASLQRAGEAAGYRDGPRAVAAVIRAALDARLRRPAPRPASVWPVETNRRPAGHRGAGPRPAPTRRRRRGLR